MIATLALLGAVTGVDALQDFGGARPMLPVGALAILIAAAGLVRRRGLGVPLVLGGAIALAGLLPSGQEIPVNAAVCVILIGVGLLCLSRHRELGRRLRARRRADRGARAARVPLRGPGAAARAAVVAAHADGRADRLRPARAQRGAAGGAHRGWADGAVEQRRSRRRARPPAWRPRP